MRRSQLQPDVVRCATLLIYIVPLIVLPPRLFKNLSSRRFESPRQRALSAERSDRIISRSRKIAVVALALIIFGELLFLLLPGATAAQRQLPDPAIVLLVANCIGMRWNVGRLADEGDRWQYLVAINRALIVTLCASATALVVTSDRMVDLRPALEVTLLLGCLTWNLSLVLDDRRAAAVKE